MGLGKLIRGLGLGQDSSTKAPTSSKAAAARAKAAPPSTSAPVNPTPAPKATTSSARATNSTDSTPYSDARALQLFNTNADPELPATNPAIGSEGLEQLCEAAGINMAGVQPLLLAWLLQCKVMGQITKAEWIAGTQQYRIDTPARIAAILNDLDELLMTDRSVKAYKPKPADAYNREAINSYVLDRQAAFTSFYNFWFGLAKGDARNVELEMACALWGVLLAPKFPLAGTFVEWITEKKTVKGVNKDLWSMLLEFCQTVDPALSNFDNDGAWPTAIDDFVEWKKAQYH